MVIQNKENAFMMMEELKWDNFNLVNSLDERIFYKGFRWAEPNRDSFVKKLLSAYRNHEEIKEKSVKYSEKICKEFSKESIMSMYDKILESL